MLSSAAICMMSGWPMFASMSITLQPNRPSPQPVGSSITWTATVSDTEAGPHEYRYSTFLIGTAPQIRRAFSSNSNWTWTPSEFEGWFEVTVAVRNTSTGATNSVNASYQLTSRLVNGYASVNPTNHPLVALFSAPPCLVPNSMRVRFRRPGGSASQTTSLLPCRVVRGSSLPNVKSMNFYVAGMYPNSTYLMNWETVAPNGVLVHTGTPYPFTTGSIPSSVPIPSYSRLLPPPPGDTEQPVLLQSFTPRNRSPYVPIATDLQGNVLWYYPVPSSFVDRTEFGGNMMVRRTGPGHRLLQEIDLAGNVVRETNVARVSEQLVAMGLPRIVVFTHELRRIVNPGGPNDGYIMALGTTDLISTQYQGGTPGNPVEILGDEVIVLDRNLQVSWAWNPFTHLDLARRAVLNETCTPTTVCRPITPGFTLANDWLHANSIQYTPWDRNLIVSLRHQDWVIKLNYADGAGDGTVLWRMGPQGDFTITTQRTANTADIGFPWFSHQHDAEFELGGQQFGGRRIMTVFDNGNTRQVTYDSNAHSRCQSLAVDEVHRTVNLNINADLGAYSVALGSAQLLTNGDLACGAGAIGAFSRATENQKNGKPVYLLQWFGNTYRTFRMADLYTPVTP